jgi:hypothetical protein
VWPPHVGYDLTVWNAPTSGPGWSDNIGNAVHSETFVVRGGAVPEPGSLMLLALGLLALARGRRLA